MEESDMEHINDDGQMKSLFDLFMGSFVENRDPRMDLEINALKKLTGSYLERAKASILERIKKSPGEDSLRAARSVNLIEAVPFLQTWLQNIRNNPAHAYRWTSVQSDLAYTLYQFTNDESYIPDIVEYVRNEGYGEFTNGVYLLSQIPVTRDGIAAVWEKYKRGKRIRYPYSWLGACQYFFRQKIDEPLTRGFINTLSDEERAELLELISEDNSLSKRHREQLSKRGNEYSSVGSSPIQGLTLTQIWRGHTDYISTLEWSRDGVFLLSNTNRYTREDRTTRIWSLGMDHEFNVFQPKVEDQYGRFHILAAAWLGRERRIIEAYEEYQGPRDQNHILIWHAEKDEPPVPVFVMSDTKPIREFICFPNGKTLLISILYHNQVLLIDLETKAARPFLQELPGRIELISLSPDGTRLGLVYQELTDPLTGREYTPQFIYNGNLPIRILIYDVGAGKVVREIDTDHIRLHVTPCIQKLCWMLNQPILAAAAADNTISVWNVETGERIALLEGSVGTVIDVSFSPDGKLLVSRSYEDESLRIWRTDTWQAIGKLQEPKAFGDHLAFHPSQPFLATLGDHGKAIRIWQFDSNELLLNPPIE